MRTEVDLANLALSHLSRDGTLRNLEGSDPNSVTLKARIPFSKEYVCTEYDWPECRVVSKLVLEPTVTPPGWTYAYQVPADKIKIWYIGLKLREDKTSTPFELGMNPDVLDDKTYIFTNLADAYIRYGSSRAPLGRFTADVFNLIALKLAEISCMTLTKDAKLKSFLGQEYKMELSKVKTSAANLEPEIVDVEFVPETIQAFGWPSVLTSD